MKIAPIADVKAKFSSYVKHSQKSPVVITKNGKAVAVLLAVSDEDELERLLLAHSVKFQALLNAAEQRIRETGGIPHEDFWQMMQEESHENKPGISPTK